jgi:hypothetical protein
MRASTRSDFAGYTELPGKFWERKRITSRAGKVPVGLHPMIILEAWILAIHASLVHACQCCLADGTLHRPPRRPLAPLSESEHYAMKGFLVCCLMLLSCRLVAAQCCCDHCGCQSDCYKVCRPVCEIKKVPKVTYDCECEDFCVPGKSCHSVVCDECGNKCHVYTPTCGKVRTRMKLVKNETMVEKVTYKWVVETVCCGCRERCAAAEKAGKPLDAAATAQYVDGPDARLVNYQQAVASESAAATPAEETAAKPAKFSLQRIFKSLAD